MIVGGQTGYRDISISPAMPGIAPA